MQINRFVNGEKAKTIPKKVENEAVKEAIAEAERRRRAAEGKA